MSDRILIADDDPVVQTILEAILDSMGHKVEIVSSGRACIEHISAKAAANDLPQAVFLDLLLQDMTGLEVLTEIKRIAAEAKLPVIMLSSNSKEELAEMAPSVTPDYFLEKPFRPDSVAKALETVGKA